MDRLTSLLFVLLLAIYFAAGRPHFLLVTLALIAGAQWVCWAANPIMRRLGLTRAQDS